MIQSYLRNFLFSLTLPVILFFSLKATALSESCHNPGNQPFTSPFKVINATPDRIQWLENKGYCGETAIQSAGLYYGQYVSQYDARVLANLGYGFRKPQHHQILIGQYGSSGVDNNIINAATQMHLTYEEFNNDSSQITQETKASEKFIRWIKSHVVDHHPVIIGLYENRSIFGDTTDDEYDHIVPVFGISSSHDLSLHQHHYFSDDVIYFHDNGIYTGDGYSKVGCYHYLVGKFQKSRQAANEKNGDVYAVSDNSNNEGNYGIAILGVRAIGVSLLPISITTTPNYEAHPIKKHSNKRPPLSKMLLKTTVSKLTPHQDYILLKYNDFSDLPKNDNFTESLGHPVSQCIINISNGNTYTFTSNIQSSDIVIYRAFKKSQYYGENRLTTEPCEK